MPDIEKSSPSTPITETETSRIDNVEQKQQEKTDQEVKEVVEAAQKDPAIADKLDQALAEQLPKYPRLEVTFWATVRPVIQKAQREFATNKTTTVVDNEKGTVTTSYSRNNNPKTMMTHSENQVTINEYRRNGNPRSSFEHKEYEKEQTLYNQWEKQAVVNNKGEVIWHKDTSKKTPYTWSITSTYTEYSSNGTDKKAQSIKQTDVYKRSNAYSDEVAQQTHTRTESIEERYYRGGNHLKQKSKDINGVRHDPDSSIKTSGETSVQKFYKDWKLKETINSYNNEGGSWRVARDSYRSNGSQKSHIETNNSWSTHTIKYDKQGNYTTNRGETGNVNSSSSATNNTSSNPSVDKTQ